MQSMGPEEMKVWLLFLYFLVLSKSSGKRMEGKDEKECRMRCGETGKNRKERGRKTKGGFPMKRTVKEAKQGEVDDIKATK